MDVYQLKVFLSVFRHRSFTAASKELNLTQPSVSIHIKKLEEELGLRLFDKAGRKILPTREASLLAGKAEEIMESIRDIKSNITSARGEIRGIITIGATSIPGSYVIPPLAAEFTRLYPDVFFQVVIGESREIAEKVLGGELLVGIVEETKEFDTLDCLHRFKDELVLVSAPEFTKKNQITPLGLFSMPLLMREEDSDSQRSMQKQHLLHRISLRTLHIKAILGSTDSLREAVKAGLGATILSRFVVSGDLKAGLMKEIKIRGVKMKRQFQIITRKKRAIPEHYLAFIRFLSDKLPPP